MILVLVEQDRGGPIGLGFEALTFGRRLAERLAVPLHALLIGEAEEDAAERVAAFGASTVHIVEHEGLREYSPEGCAASVVELMEMLSPRIVLAAATDRGNEVMAHVGAMAELPMAANCTEVAFGDQTPPAPSVSGDRFVVTRLRWGGSLLEEARVEGNPKLLTIAPQAVAAEQADARGSPEIVRFTPSLSERDLRVRVSGRVEPAGDRVSLSEARIVVGGGRGVGSAEGFRILEELAGLLGGAVGGSRVVTSLGWRPHADQVGQTGTRITPDIYIACGISGAIQHMVGCKGAKRILAINSDPEAPIMAKADYAVIGDLHAVVPALCAEIRKAMGDLASS